jgi:hypothetical protein
VASLGTSHANDVLQYFEISIFKVKQATVLELHFLHCCKSCNKPTSLQNFSGYTEFTKLEIGFPHYKNATHHQAVEIGTC